MLALYYSILHLTYKLLQSVVPAGRNEEEAEEEAEEKAEEGRVFRAELAGTVYLGRSKRVNPTVFLEWGQEIAGTLYNNNFCKYGSLEINAATTIFMRNIRLLLTEKLYEVPWVSQPYRLSVEAFNSNTGKTSFDLTLRWFYDGQLIATLVRKMVYVSVTTGKPVQLPAEFIANNPDQNVIKFALNKDVPASASKSTITVRPSDIDFNGHVGHPVYVDYVLDSAFHSTYQYVPSDLMSEEIRCIDVEYRYPIVLDRGLSVRSWDKRGEEEGGVEINFVMYQRAAGRHSSDRESSQKESDEKEESHKQSNDLQSSDNSSTGKLSHEKLSSEKMSDVKQIVCLAKVLLFDK